MQKGKKYICTKEKVLHINAIEIIFQQESFRFWLKISQKLPAKTVLEMAHNVQNPVIINCTQPSYLAMFLSVALSKGKKEFPFRLIPPFNFLQDQKECEGIYV